MLLVAGVYRLLTFVPQPLDSPGTLRPHLYHWFSVFLKLHPDADHAQVNWDTVCLSLLLVPAMLALANYFWPSTSNSWIRRVLCSRTLLFAAVASALFAARFPVLLGGQINVDETQFLAAAQKLFVDPVFFRAVDCGTSGPFNIYPLMLPALLGFSPDYSSSRVVALLVILASVYLLYRTFVLLTSDDRARIAILPVAGAFASLKTGDFLHYSSEHISFFLVSVALFLCVKVLRQPAGYSFGIIGLGLLSAIAFFAKMQAVPLIAAVAAVAIAYVYSAGGAQLLWRPIVMFLAGLAPIPVLNALVCFTTGVWNDFWMSYVLANYHYVDVSTSHELWRFVAFVAGVQEIRLLIVTLLAVLAVHVYARERKPDASLYWRLAAIGGVIAWASNYVLRASEGSAAYAYPAMFCMFALAASVVPMFRRKSGRPAAVRWFGLAAAALLAAAVFAAYSPHRPFPHYLLLLVIPLSVATSWPMLASVNVVSAPFVLTFVILVLSGQCFLLRAPDPAPFSSIQPEIRAPEGDFIRSITQASDQITVWGWNATPYLSSARVAATRDLNMTNLFLRVPSVDNFYRERFLRDMKRTRPRLFIDVVGPASFAGNYGVFADRKTGGFETIPEIRSFIEANYVQATEAYGERFYLRRDLAVSNATQKRCEAAALRCYDGSNSAFSTTLAPLRLPDHVILEVVFTPEPKQDRYATVFSNDISPDEHKGFQFHHVGNDLYQLAIGLGGQWARSKPVLAPPGLPSAVSVEFNLRTVTIFYNGVKSEELQLPVRMIDSDAPITIGSWLGQHRLFQGKIQVFQIRNLGPR
jgi:hypothetical protein